MSYDRGVDQRPPLRLVEPPPPGWPDWVERWVLPYLSEPALAPVLIAVLGHVVVALAPLMLWAWRTGSGVAVALLVIAAAASLALCTFELWRFRRPRAVTLVLLGLWAASVAAAWFGERSGVL